MRKVIGLVLAALILAVLLPSVASAATSPQAEWYFAEGTTRPGFEEYLCIANPNSTVANVVIRLCSGVSVPLERVVTLGPASWATENLETACSAPQPQDVSATVTPVHPFVAERAMYFNVDNPPLQIHYTVPAQSRITIDPRVESGKRLPVATATLESDKPIAVERTLWSATPNRMSGWALPALPALEEQ